MKAGRYAGRVHILLVLVMAFSVSPDGRSQSREASPQLDGPGRIVTEDVDRFFSAARRARSSEDPVGVLQREYLDRGTEGLRFYHESARLESAERLWRNVERYWPLYETVGRFYEDLIRNRNAFEGPYRYFDRLMPGAETPPVYFIVGHFQGGATVFDAGLVIAIDNWAADWGGFQDLDWEFQTFDPVEILQPLVAHELAHFHQSCLGDCGSLLAESMMEGGADFVAWLITGAETNHFNRSMYAYFREHESTLWPRFYAARHGSELSPWLYDNSTDMPANLGYAIGHAITRAFWERHGRTDEAVRAILAISDYEAFLASSGYAPAAGDR